MFKKSLKKFVSIVLSTVMVMGMSTTAFAEENFPVSVNAPAKAAIVTNVAKDGSNLTDDRHINSNTEIYNVSMNITALSDNMLNITSTIGNQEILVTGVPVAKSANNHAIFYQATSNNDPFEVVNMEYVDNAETNMFFKNYKVSNNADKILKLYLKDMSTDTPKYIILECFDYEVGGFSQLISILPQDTTMGAWAAKEFTPASVSYGDISTYASTSNTSRTYTVKYNDLALEQTHKITLATDCIYSNIRVGQMTDIVYRIEITGKSMTCPDNPSLNSRTESYLHVDAAALRQTTVPNVAFVSTSIDGKVQNNSWGGASLSASIGVGLGALGVSLSVPVSFSGSSTVNINNTYEGYVNGRNNKYTRSIKTTMKSNYKLTQIGYYFEVRSTIADFGNTTKSSASHKAAWDITIINAADLSTQTKTIIQNVPISIVK